MEEVVLVKRLRGMGSVVLANERVQTSPRRWERLGVVRTTAVNQVILLGYAAGVPLEHLAAWYRGRQNI